MSAGGGSLPFAFIVSTDTHIGELTQESGAWPPETTPTVVTRDQVDDFVIESSAGFTRRTVVAWFDFTWVETSMVPVNLMLNADVRIDFDDDGAELRGEWITAGGPPVESGSLNLETDPAFTVPLSEWASGMQSISIEIDVPEAGLDFGGFVGMRLALRAGEPSGQNMLFFGGDPTLSLQLNCPVPEPPLPPPAFARPFDPRYRDRLPRSSVHQSAAWKSQIATEIEAELRPRSKRKVKR